jgi:3-oxoacyl-[acyl-carrier protein] reductase
MRLTEAGLPGKRALVTGAAGGIGSAIAAALARHDVHVCLTDTDDKPLERLVQALPHPERHAYLSADLSEPEAAKATVQHANEALGGLDILVHTAAVLLRRDTDKVTAKEWDTQIDTNLRSTFFLSQAAGEVLRRSSEAGRIIVFTSDAWWTGGLNGATAYAASKGGVVSLTRGFARELAQYRITVNAIAPAMVDTPMLRAELTQQQLDRYAAQVPLGRMARPEEIADAVVFLASDAAAYITGATLNISGGFLSY